MHQYIPRYLKVSWWTLKSSKTKRITKQIPKHFFRSSGNQLRATSELWTCSLSARLVKWFIANKSKLRKDHFFKNNQENTIISEDVQKSMVVIVSSSGNARKCVKNLRMSFINDLETSNIIIQISSIFEYHSQSISSKFNGKQKVFTKMKFSKSFGPT